MFFNSCRRCGQAIPMNRGMCILCLIDGGRSQEQKEMGRAIENQEIKATKLHRDKENKIAKFIDSCDRRNNGHN